jgi:ribosomal protein S27E
MVTIVLNPMDLLSGIDVKCPACGRRSRYPVVHAGKTVSCPGCKHEHIIPEQDGTGIHPILSSQIDAPSVPTAPPLVPPAPTASKKVNTQPMSGDTEKILFVCGSCQYRARIPAQYAGMAVRCPSCDAAQIANIDGATGSTGKTVQLSKIPTAGHKTTIRPGNVLFICSQCNFEAQLAKHYVGKAIRCPGCHAPQVVAGEAQTSDPAALERNPGVPAMPAGDPRFICVGCGYRARIPTQYMGLAVTCPKCDTVQIATPEDQESPSTGDTVSIAKLKTADAGAQIANPQVTVTSEPTIKGPSPKPAPPAAPGDKVRFTCSSCSFKARIPASYAGENIHCPSCNAVQLVLRSGQLSPNATGNTQILQVVQTAESVGSPDAIATPTNTPSRGVPILKNDGPPAPTVAKPAAPGYAAPTLPPPALTVAQPAGTAAKETSIDDLLNFEDSAHEAKKAETKDESKMGKVVRRGSDRLAAIKMKTPSPEPLAAPAKPESKSYKIDNNNNAADEGEMEEKKNDKPAAPAKSNKGTVSVARPTVARSEAARSEAKPEAKLVRKIPSESAAQKTSNGLVIVVGIIGIGLLAGLGGLGYLVMKGQEQMNKMQQTLGSMQDDLASANQKLSDTNEKLTKAEEEAKLAKEAAELARMKATEEAAARKAAEAAAVELEAKLKAAEEKAAADKAAAEKAAAEKPAPVEAPQVAP